MIAMVNILEDFPLETRLEASPNPHLPPLLDIPLGHVRDAIGILTNAELAAMDNDDLASLIIDAQIPAHIQAAHACQAASLFRMPRQQLLQLATEARNFCLQ